MPYTILASINSTNSPATSQITTRDNGSSSIPAEVLQRLLQGEPDDALVAEARILTLLHPVVLEHSGKHLQHIDQLGNLCESTQSNDIAHGVHVGLVNTDALVDVGDDHDVAGSARAVVTVPETADVENADAEKIAVTTAESVVDVGLAGGAGFLLEGRYQVPIDAQRFLQQHLLLYQRARYGGDRVARRHATAEDVAAENVGETAGVLHLGDLQGRHYSGGSEEFS